MTAPGEVQFEQPAPISPELLAYQDRLVRATHEAMGVPADPFRGVDRSATPKRLSGAVLATPRRPDGFDQRQVDAARAALLASAPPRYPRTR